MGAKITYDFLSRTTRSRGLVTSVCLLLSMLFYPAFSLYARAQAIALGTDVSNAPTITISAVTADVTDGDENFFILTDTYLPTAVYYLPDTAFGPIPSLINVVTKDTLKAEMVFEDCRMAWRWNVEQTADPQEKFYLYFATHETAKAEIIPTCTPVHVDLPDASGCGSYVWGDTTIYDSGDYTRHFISSIGCDSTTSMHVDIFQSTEATDNIVAYDSVKWINGKTYYGSISGPVYTIPNAAGCDSVITLNLTVRHLWTDTAAVTICQTEAPYNWKGLTIWQSGLYSTDTITGPVVNKVFQDTVHSLDITVNPAYEIDTVVTLCDSLYTWHDSTYTRSGVYADSLQTVDGCDSVILLHLTLTDECFPKVVTCVEALRQIEECLIIDHSMVEDLQSKSITWLCDGKQIDADTDRLPMADRSNGVYSAYLLQRDCQTCDTVWLCEMEYVQGVKKEQQAILSVHPTYIAASEPYIYLTATSGAGNYYLYGPAGKIVLRGEYDEKTGTQKLALPAISGLYVLICLPEGEKNMDHVVQKIKILVY